MPSARRVAIVGGGAAGTLVALQLLSRQATRARGVEITVCEPRSDLGRGLAYSTDSPTHLLNVTAAQMSAFPDDPDDFVRWSGLAPGDFAPRSVFGDYLAERLHGAVEQTGARFHHSRTRVTDLERDGNSWSVRTVDGGRLAAGAVVLAVGNPPSRIPQPLRELVGTEMLVENPWAPGALARVQPGDHVVCIGTGLTFVDVALQLCEIDGVSVTGISRHGLLPRRHGPSGDPPAVPIIETPLQGLRWLRSHGDDWRAAMGALRPLTPGLWHEFSERARRQFLRHPLRYWEVHRHRLAPTVADRLASLMSDGRASVRRGRIVSADTDVGNGVHLMTDAGALRATTVVLCTGGDDAALTADGVVASLISSGHARLAPLAMGIDVDVDSGAVTSGRGTPSPGLYAIGSVRRGVQWETTAIPEIRTQAAGIALAILG